MLWGASMKCGTLQPIGIVSLGVVALNEEQSLPGLFEDILSQVFPHDRMEVVLVDSGSSDGTRALMEGFACEHAGEFFGISVFDNAKRIQAAGWNVFIRSAKGDALIRVDAHASIASDFVSRSVAALDSGESVCGGYRPTIVAPSQSTPWHETLHLAEEAAFGSSVSSFRRLGEARYVDSVFHGAYRRGVLDEVGVFDERLLRTEDNDLHYRIRKAGYNILFDPMIKSAQYVRASFYKMLRQKYGNGYWVGRTLFIQPKCLQLYHFAPLVFVLGIIALALTGVLVSWIPFLGCAAMYTLLCILLSLRAVCQSESRNVTMVALPFVFFGIHLAYGIGTVAGMIRGLLGALRFCK